MERNKRFANKVVIVTGSARGIGKNIAHAFGQEDARVVICDLDEKNGKATVDEFLTKGISAKYLPVDLSKSGAPQSMIQEVVKQMGGLDILVNNARSGKRTTLSDENDESWDEGIAVTLKAAYFASQEAIHTMAQNGKGSIVNISSIMSQFTSNESPIYHISKAGMSHMTRYFATHAGRFGIRVNAVLPGFIVQDEHRERFFRDDNKLYRETAEYVHPLGSVGSSNDIAKAVLFLCSDEAAFITGQSLVVDGGATLQEQQSLLNQFSKKYIAKNALV